MELSSEDAYFAVEQALSAIENVTFKRLPKHQINVTIQTDDPDLVDIVREIAWEYDPAAVQHSLLLADVS
jgi:adenosine deaminase